MTSDAWRYTAASEINGVNIWGQFAVYGGGGYVAELDVSRTISRMILDELREHRWLVPFISLNHLTHMFYQSINIWYNSKTCVE